MTGEGLAQQRGHSLPPSRSPSVRLTTHLETADGSGSGARDRKQGPVGRWWRPASLLDGHSREAGAQRPRHQPTDQAVLHAGGCGARGRGLSAHHEDLPAARQPAAVHSLPGGTEAQPLPQPQIRSAPVAGGMHDPHRQADR